MGGGGSAVVRRQLGRRLRELRLAAGKEIADVGVARLGSKAKMSRIENGKQPVRVADVVALCEFYGADARTTAALRAMAPGTQQDDWWDFDRGAVPAWVGFYAGLEGAASRIRSFEPQFVHGLLQTEAYARGLLGGAPRLSPDAVEQRVRFRMERQQRSWDHVTVIMGEGALRTVIGSPAVLAEQLERIRASTADVRVLPFSAGASPVAGSWALLEFEDAADPTVVYVEGAGIARYLDRPVDRAEYEEAWSSVVDRAVPIGEWPE